MANNHSNQSKRSFWTSLPGILTGIASILAAVGAVSGLVLSHGSSRSPAAAAAAVQNSSPQATVQTWSDQANAICAIAIKNGSGYEPSNPFISQLPAATQLADNFQSVDDQLRKLPANGQDQGSVTSMLTYWDQAITSIRAAIQAAQNGDYATAQQDLLSSNNFNTEGNSLANELGAGTCASGTF
jgi:hypothetical protein